MRTCLSFISLKFPTLVAPFLSLLAISLIWSWGRIAGCGHGSNDPLLLVHINFELYRCRFSLRKSMRLSTQTHHITLFDTMILEKPSNLIFGSSWQNILLFLFIPNIPTVSQIMSERFTPHCSFPSLFETSSNVPGALPSRSACSGDAMVSQPEKVDKFVVNYNNLTGLGIACPTSFDFRSLWRPWYGHYRMFYEDSQIVLPFHNNQTMERCTTSTWHVANGTPFIFTTPWRPMTNLTPTPSIATL